MTFLNREDLSLKWCVAVGTALLLLLFWRRSKRKQQKRVTRLPMIPFFYKMFIEFVLRPVEQKKNFKISDYLIPIVSGLTHLYRKEKLIEVVWAGHRLILCCDASTSEKIFQSSYAINKDWLYKVLEPWLGQGLLTSGEDRWRVRRKMLTPAFHFRILKDFLGVFNEQSKILVESLNKFDGKIVDISEVVPLCTLDIIGETAMGVHLNAQTGEGAEYVEAVKFLTSAVVTPFMIPWYWITPLYQLTSHAKQQKKCISIVHNFARNVIRRRKEKILEGKEIKELFDDFQEVDDVGTKNRRAFLDLLLYHHLTDNSLSEEDIREEVDTFTFEGHDTTSMAISWTIYLLGLHKDIQERAYQELWEIYGDDKERKVTIVELKEMKYLECIVKETLRLFPSVPFTLRRTTKDIEADDCVIPADSSVAVVIYTLHRDSTLFPNPEVFDPDRFLPQNSHGRNPFAYVPFSAGSRNCIGQRFAMMEVKTVISYIVRNFRISSLDHRDKLNFAGDIILRPTEPIRIIFEKR